MVRTPTLVTLDCATKFDSLQPELSIAPHLNSKLIPKHLREKLKEDLAQEGVNLDNFVPLTKDQMMAKLD